MLKPVATLLCGLLLEAALLLLQMYAQVLHPPDYQPSVVQIVVEHTIASNSRPIREPIGTGFIIREDGIIATADHVYGIANKESAKYQNGRILVQRVAKLPNMVILGVVELLTRDNLHDLALLRLSSEDANVWRKKGGLRSLSLTDQPEIEVSTPVRVVGYPGSELLPVTLMGYLVGTTTLMIDKHPVEEFVISLSAVPGQSGSPVLLEDGTVLGVLSALQRVELSAGAQPNYTGLNRIAKAEYLRKLLSTVTLAAAPH
jgi:S1-C subfamily serine protease